MKAKAEILKRIHFFTDSFLLLKKLQGDLVGRRLVKPVDEVGFYKLTIEGRAWIKNNTPVQHVCLCGEKHQN